MESGVVREVAASVEHYLELGPGGRCEETDQAIVCSGGESEVIGEGSTHPW